MKIMNTLEEWINVRNNLSSDVTTGFAPTMGNLHAGHASLFLTSKIENQYTISSLFTNPTQFDRPDDFLKYPRTLEADLAIMEDAGVDFCILPDTQEMYADGYHYEIHENELCQQMEGVHRPGHFDGVLTVVMKLLNLTKPTRAYFGEKDYQQYLLIKGMTKAFFMDLEIKVCHTIRENSGLAFSSRNNRLSKEQKLHAEQFARIFHQKKPCEEIISELNAADITVEYVKEYQGRKYAAVMIGDIRLIDNYRIKNHDLARD